jgi:hypothetical protein
VSEHDDDTTIAPGRDDDTTISPGHSEDHDDGTIAPADRNHEDRRDAAAHPTSPGGDEARDVDAAVRALRDEPVGAERLARMRARLDARIAAASDPSHADAPGDAAAGNLSSIEGHPRWRSRPALAAAALAAAVLLAVLVGRSRLGDEAREPREVARETTPVTPAAGPPSAAPGEGRWRDPEDRPAPARDQATEVVPPDQLALDEAADTASATAVQAPTPTPTPTPIDRVVADERPGSAGGSAAPAVDLDAATDEELAVALQLERLTDYDVIAQLELLEALDELGADGRI